MAVGMSWGEGFNDHLRDQSERNKALRGLVEAWERLPEGKHTVGDVEDWLRDEMKPAFDRARIALGRT